jgi:filamentous hemagglutinin family protein
MPFSLLANPQGITVVAGSASAQSSGSQLKVTTSQNAFLDWRSFNILPGETTSFIQPSANSVVLNLIGGTAPSQIWGHLTANGTVILANAHGFYFGPNSLIQVGGSFVATTAPITPDLGAGAGWQFTGLPPLASIVNYGEIEAGPKQSLFLIAEQLENHGQLKADAGSIGLVSGQDVLLSERPDGRGLSATVTLPSGSVDNTGRIVADAGAIALQAQVVNQNGILQADSVREQNGEIELVASSQINLGSSSQILANGDDTVKSSAGGAITIRSDGSFSDAAGSTISVRGGARGGDGGNIEISAPEITSLNTAMDAGAQPGWRGGTFLLDPANIVLGTTGAGGPDSTGTVAYDSGSGTVNIDVNTAFANKNFSSILLQATGNITLAANTTWNLSRSTGNTSGQLTLEAGGNITFGTGAKLIDANNWSATLEAGYSFADNQVEASSSGLGSIVLNGGKNAQSDPIQLSAGSLNLVAAQSITLGFGAVYTTGGGNIFAEALAGDINLGTANGGYQYYASAPTAAPNPGGIATGAGGDVTLLAGGNVIGQIGGDSVAQNVSPGASGAFGPGNVTVIAGKQITGSFNLADGVGTLLAGVSISPDQAAVLQEPNADHTAVLKQLETAVTQAQNPDGNIGVDAGNLVNLNLTEGSWSAWAANNIYLGEVRNPNGTYNGNFVSVPSGEFPGNTDNPVVPGSLAYLLDYAPDAAVHLWAGDGITLDGTSLQRQTGNTMSPVYPPILTLDAGSGGITLDSSIYLYPSSQGSLQVATRSGSGGNLAGAVQSDNSLVTLTMSDSGLPDWQSIENGGHAVIPLHLNDPNPVIVDISGSIGSFGLNVPTCAQITVDGTAPYVLGSQSFSGTYNFGFSGQNLSRTETTFIDVTGSISYRGDVTPATLSSAPPGALFSDSSEPEITDKLRYDAATGTLIFIGVMGTAKGQQGQSVDELTYLLNPTVYVLDSSGNQVLDANGNPETQPLTFASQAALAAYQTAVRQLYTDSQTAQIGSVSLALAGPGVFKIRASQIDLGNSGGIFVAPLDSTLAAIYPRGADLEVQTDGDLTMTSSQIANESWLGGITLNVGGSLNVGGQFTAFDDPSAPKGIFTTSGGDVSVTAQSEVNVNGSRIAAYNGGNVSVTSVTGDVDAGVGGAGYVSVAAQELSSSGQLTQITQSIPGSGILATTLPGSSAATLGDITVAAPNGNINASLGGIIQIAFNSADSSQSVIALSAGQNIDASGSGVIGSNLKITAGGKTSGLFVGTGNVNINSQQGVNATVFGVGDVTINSSGGVTGTIISGGAADVTGSAITASLIAETVNATGDTSGASMGIPQSNVARDDAKVADDASTMVASSDSQAADDDDEKKKRGNGAPRLGKTIGRVTVLPLESQP